MKKILISIFTLIILTGCGSTADNQVTGTSDESSLVNTNEDKSQLNIEDTESILEELKVDGQLSMRKYYDMFTTDADTITVGKLEITNKGVTDHDLVSIADNIACQTYLSKAKKLNLEITNNYDIALDYSNNFLGDIWDISYVVTDKTIKFLDSGDFGSMVPTEEDEFYGTLDPFQFQGDYLGECFQQQSQRFVAQPGETVIYPLYFSLQDKFTEEAKEYYLNVIPYTLPLPENHPIKDIDLSMQPGILKLEI